MNALVERFYNVACMNRFDVHVLMDYHPNNIYGFNCSRCNEFHVVTRNFYTYTSKKLRSQSRAEALTFQQNTREVTVEQVFKEELLHYYGDNLVLRVAEMQEELLTAFREKLCTDAYEKSIKTARSFELYCPLHGYHLISRASWGDFQRQYELTGRIKQMCGETKTHPFVRQAVLLHALNEAKALKSFFEITPHVVSESPALVKSSRFPPAFVAKLNLPDELNPAEVSSLYVLPSSYVPRQYMIEFGACGRKRRYSNEGETVEAMKEIKVGEAYQPYACSFCDGWHYGRKSAKKVTESSRYSTGLFWYKRHPDKANQFFMRLMEM